MCDTTASIITRAITDRDMDPVTALLDSVLGHNYWALDPGSAGSHRLAVLNDDIVGVASGCLVDGLADSPDLCSPVGLLRLVAVAPSFQRLGIASLLVNEVCKEIKLLGAIDLVSYAWVHGHIGIAPLAGVLTRLGFVMNRRIEGFYANAGSGLCPGCGHEPCVCSADLYMKRA